MEQHSRKGKTSSQEVKRIKIILKGSQGQSNYSISKDLKLGVEAVSSWRNRWTSSCETLKVFEKGESGEGVSDRALLKKMLEVLKDHPRCGKPAQFTMSQKQQIVAMACRKPSEYGIPRTGWTHELLAQTAQTKRIVKSISPRYVGEILKKSGSTPA